MADTRTSSSLISNMESSSNTNNLSFVYMWAVLFWKIRLISYIKYERNLELWFFLYGHACY